VRVLQGQACEIYPLNLTPKIDHFEQPKPKPVETVLNKQPVETVVTCHLNFLEVKVVPGCRRSVRLLLVVGLLLAVVASEVVGVAVAGAREVVGVEVEEEAEDAAKTNLIPFPLPLALATTATTTTPLGALLVAIVIAVHLGVGVKRTIQPQTVEGVPEIVVPEAEVVKVHEEEAEVQQQETINTTKATRTPTQHQRLERLVLIRVVAAAVVAMAAVALAAVAMAAVVQIHL